MVFYPCIKCRKNVRPRQHAVSCDNCGKWQHRTCQTGISLKSYTEAVRRNLYLEFICRPCEEKLQNINHDDGNVENTDVTNSSLSHSSIRTEGVSGDCTVQTSVVEGVITDVPSSGSVTNENGDFQIILSLARANSTQVDLTDEAEFPFDVSSMNQSVTVDDQLTNQSNVSESDTRIQTRESESLSASFDVNIECNQTEEIEEQSTEDETLTTSTVTDEALYFHYSPNRGRRGGRLVVNSDTKRCQFILIFV